MSATQACRVSVGAHRPGRSSSSNATAKGPPARTAIISARMLTAISRGSGSDLEPAERTVASSKGGTPRPGGRRRLDDFGRLPRSPTKRSPRPSTPEASRPLCPGHRRRKSWAERHLLARRRSRPPMRSASGKRSAFANLTGRRRARPEAQALPSAERLGTCGSEGTDGRCSMGSNTCILPRDEPSSPLVGVRS